MKGLQVVGSQVARHQIYPLLPLVRPDEQMRSWWRDENVMVKFELEPGYVEHQMDVRQTVAPVERMVVYVSIGPAVDVITTSPPLVLMEIHALAVVFLLLDVIADPASNLPARPFCEAVATVWDDVPLQTKKQMRTVMKGQVVHQELHQKTNNEMHLVVQRLNVLVAVLLHHPKLH
jgi:hypothetical protein